MKDSYRHIRKSPGDEDIEFLGQLWKFMTVNFRVKHLERILILKA